MATYLGYTLRMRTLFRGWPIMVNDTHTRRRRRPQDKTAQGKQLKTAGHSNKFMNFVSFSFSSARVVITTSPIKWNEFNYLWTCPMECSIKSKVVYSTALCQINVVDCAAHSCGVVQPLQRAVPLTQENVVYIHSDHWVIAIYVIESHLTKNDPEQTIQSNMTTEIFAHVGQSQLTSYQIYKKKERLILREIHLRTTRCHLSMGSNSVICHPTEVTAPPSPQPGRLLLDLSTP